MTKMSLFSMLYKYPILSNNEQVKYTYGKINFWYIQPIITIHIPCIHMMI